MLGVSLRLRRLRCHPPHVGHRGPALVVVIVVGGVVWRYFGPLVLVPSGF